VSDRKRNLTVQTVRKTVNQNDDHQIITTDNKRAPTSMSF